MNASVSLRKILLVATLALAVSPVHLPAQGAAVPVRAFRSFSRGTGSPGLPASTVVSLHTDREGTVWIATFDGLAHVQQGTVERLAASPNAPVSGSVFRVIDRKNGGIYASGSKGLHVFDGRTWSLIPTPEEFTAIAEDRNNTVIALDRRGGLWAKVVSSTQWAQIHGLADSYELRALASTSDGRVLAAGVAGVAIVENSVVQGLLEAHAAPAPLTTLLVAPDGRVWAGGEDGRLHSWSENVGWQSFAIPEWDGGRIRSIAEGTRGRIWVGGDNGRVGVGNTAIPFERWTTLTGVKASSVTALAGDLTGAMWLGFNGSGLQQWVGESWTHRTYWREPGDVEAPITFSVRATSDNGFVAAVFNRGVWKWDGQTMTVFGREQGITEDVRFAVEPEPGVIWAGARTGIFEGKGGKFTRTLTLPTGFVSGFFKSPTGEWWATTTADGVFVRVGNAWQPHAELNAELAKFSSNIRDLTRRANGDVWIATGRDLVVVPRDNIKGTAAKALPDGITQPTAFVERKGDLWVGGVGGIAIYTNESVRTILPSAGLPGNTVYAMANATDESLWVGGSSGVGHMVGDAWTVYDASNALISEECNTFGLLTRPSGEVIVGTMSGLAMFSTTLPPAPPTPLRVFWRTPSMSADGVVSVPANDRRVTLQWSAPWPRPVPIEYRTRIVELGDAWSEPQTATSFRVENFSAGTYTVEVAARFQRAGTSEWTTPITTTVVVAPQPWETWWAKLAGIGLLVFGVLMVIRWRTSRLAARAFALEMAVTEAMSNAKVLRGLLPICAHCKKVRDDHGYWTRIEDYISRHSEADFSHGFCPDCLGKHYGDLDVKDVD